MAEGTVAADELRLLIERIERLEEEKKAISDDVKDVYGEAKSRGYDTKTIRAMAEAAKAKNPKMLISDQVNVSSMVRIHVGAPHDWERHSDFLDTLSMDLYGLPNDHWKFYAKLMRATFGNQKPVMMYWGCDARAETVRPNMDYLLMWGIDGLIQYSPGSIYKLVNDEVKKNYRRLEYTGLGDLLAR